jgi:hypothetical protein
MYGTRQDWFLQGTRGHGIEYLRKIGEYDNTGALNLGQCYRSALKRSETIAISEESIVQAEEQFKQAWRSIPPQALPAWAGTLAGHLAFIIAIGLNPHHFPVALWKHKGKPRPPNLLPRVRRNTVGVFLYTAERVCQKAGRAKLIPFSVPVILVSCPD